MSHIVNSEMLIKLVILTSKSISHRLVVTYFFALVTFLVIVYQGDEAIPGENGINLASPIGLAKQGSPFHHPRLQRLLRKLDMPLY
jgi:hypothetical protein